ncbi:hypothetical protein HK098_005364 [Nowakowskiella sp. JEL0407]|nr:hypothetical protein HK098_005364 [Nowakowskiella sp. JEL0407]
MARLSMQRAPLLLLAALCCATLYSLSPGPVSVSPGSLKKPKPPLPPIDPLEYYSTVLLILVLVLTGGILAGLTIGLLSLDETNLSILIRSGSPSEKKYAERIIPIRKNSHLLLVTLLLANTVVNETLPVLFHEIRLDGVQAVLISTALIVVFGEIIPQAVCSRYGLQVGAFFAYPVQILIWIMYILAYPISKLLDWVLGPSHGMVYRKAELKELLTMHGEDQSGPLTKDEVTIVHAVLDLREKTVSQVMTEINDVFMISSDSRLDSKLIETIIQKGHSRVPIYNSQRHNIIGVLLVKQLLSLSSLLRIQLSQQPEQFNSKSEFSPLISELKLRRLPRVKSDTPLFEMLHVFEQGGSHMAVVVEEYTESTFNSNMNSNMNSSTVNSVNHSNSVNGNAVNVGGGELKPSSPYLSTKQKYIATASPLWIVGDGTGNTPPSGVKRYTVLGIVTLEDVIEELLGEEIIDETDVFVDNKSKERVVRTLQHMKRNSLLRYEDPMPEYTLEESTPPSNTISESTTKLISTPKITYGTLTGVTGVVSATPGSFEEKVVTFGAVVGSLGGGERQSSRVSSAGNSERGDEWVGVATVSSMFRRKEKRRKTKEDVVGSVLVEEYNEDS